jgi:hypothetical protein
MGQEFGQPSGIGFIRLAAWPLPHRVRMSQQDLTRFHSDMVNGLQ